MNVPADASLLCDEADVFGDMIKGTHRRSDASASYFMGFVL
jgi:hypothetical protein